MINPNGVDSGISKRSEEKIPTHAQIRAKQKIWTYMYMIDKVGWIVVGLAPLRR
jgi:hypothetical protein